MKNLMTICWWAFVATACQNTPPSENIQNEQPKVLEVPPLPDVSPDEATDWRVTAGTLYWSATKANGSGHRGTVTIKDGTVKVGKGQLLNGRVHVDMTSITVSDIENAAERTELENHLKSKDFFEVAKFPTATFEIVEVLPSVLPEFNRVIVGTLALKGKQGSVNIPILWKAEGSKAMAKSATFTIDRTKWGIVFHSGVIGTVKDKLIEDNILLSFELEAQP